MVATIKACSKTLWNILKDEVVGRGNKGTVERFSELFAWLQADLKRITLMRF